MDAIESVFLKVKSRVMFVILIGSYQTGKSSKIGLLTGLDDIEIGKCCDETTNGAIVYGPFSFN